MNFRARHACIAGLLGFALLTIPAFNSTAGAGTAQTTGRQTPVPMRASQSHGTVIPMSTADCPSTNFCGWHDANFSGTIYLHDAQTQGQDQWLGLPNSNNVYSSLYNNRANSTEVADGGPSSPGPREACLPPRSSYVNLANYVWPGTGTSMNDSISSIYMFSFVAC
jgi:hypothetical protein